MSGYNRNQEQLISLTQLKQALSDFALIPTTVVQAQQTLLAQHFISSRKKPSIFAAGTHLDAVNTYTVAGTSAGTALKYWTGVQVSMVKVFNIQDADVVRINFWLATLTASFVPFQIGFVLSTSDVFNAVPMEQSSFLGSHCSYCSGTGVNQTFQFIGDEIPVSGYKYIHIFGAASTDGDMWQSVINNPPSGTVPQRYSGMTYALIK